MKKHLLLALMALFAAELGYSQLISNGIFGQNANLTAVVGINDSAGGKLDLYWDISNPSLNYTAQSKVKFMRYDGIEVEKYCLIDGDPLQGPPTASNIYKTIADYIAKAKKMQENGITPMMALPLNQGFGSNFTLAATQAAKLVKGVNDGLAAAGAPYSPVLYWIYSNEPENGGIHFYDDTLAAQKIHDYTKAYYEAIYNFGGSTPTNCWNAAWGTPQFIGPELYSFDNYDHSIPYGSGNKVNRLIDQLTGKYLFASAGNCDITQYISIFSVHYYPT